MLNFWYEQWETFNLENFGGAKSIETVDPLGLCTGHDTCHPNGRTRVQIQSLMNILRKRIFLDQSIATEHYIALL